MTLDDLVEQASAEGLTPEDVDDLLSATTKEEARDRLEGIRAANRGPDLTGWQRFAAAAETVEGLAEKAGPIIGVIAALAPLV